MVVSKRLRKATATELRTVDTCKLWLTAPKNPGLVFLKDFLTNAMVEDLTVGQVDSDPSVVTMHLKISDPDISSVSAQLMSKQFEAAVACTVPAI